MTDVEDRFLVGTRDLIHDRDPLFTTEFRQILGSAGVKSVKLPARSSDLKGKVERGIRKECLSQVVPLGARHLRWVVSECVEHHHLERNHQGLGNELIEPGRGSNRGRLACRERLGGLLQCHYRQVG